ncbi:MAG: DUF4386 domain-containing protein [Austwickia sp.]|jgi:hypothetical protein|nr:MAG: DUF4386 domain-containing protein [Austwickia sp.]
MTTSERRLALGAAGLYLLTWVTSVAAVPLYGGSSFDPGAHLAGRESVLLAAVLEVVLAVAVVGTALALYPLLRRHGRGAALGYVALRTLEATVILVGVLAILPAVARPASTAAPGLEPAVVSGFHLLHDWTFLVGPGLINPVNAAVLATLLLRRRLVAPFIPVLGLVGASLVAGMNLVVLFGLGSPQPALAIPLFAWEICLATYLALRGLRSPADERLPHDRAMLAPASTRPAVRTH